MKHNFIDYLAMFLAFINFIWAIKVDNIHSAIGWGLCLLVYNIWLSTDKSPNKNLKEKKG